VFIDILPQIDTELIEKINTNDLMFLLKEKLKLAMKDYNPNCPSSVSLV
jgi:hypothetical protein